MKISSSGIKRIIREEIMRSLREDSDDVETPSGIQPLTYYSYTCVSNLPRGKTYDATRKISRNIGFLLNQQASWIGPESLEDDVVKLLRYVRTGAWVEVKFLLSRQDGIVTIEDLVLDLLNDSNLMTNQSGVEKSMMSALIKSSVEDAAILTDLQHPDFAWQGDENEKQVLPVRTVLGRNDNGTMWDWCR